MTNMLTGSESAYKIVVKLREPMLRQEKEALEAAITKCLHDCVAGGFEIDENWEIVTFYREADTDAPLIRERYQGPGLEEPTKAAMNQLAAEFEDCKPTNEALLSIVDLLKGAYSSYVSMVNGEGLVAYVREALKQARADAAEHEFEVYDFGETGVQGTGGWEYSSNSNERSRQVFITDDEAESDDAPTVKVNFTIKFKPWSAEVEEAYAMTESGNFLGKRYVPPVQPVQAPEVTDPTAVLALLAQVEGPASFNSGILWLENGQSFTLEDIQKQLEIIVKKAKALDDVMEELTEAGFGTDEPINGGDCVDLVCGIYGRLTSEFPAT